MNFCRHACRNVVPIATLNVMRRNQRDAKYAPRKTKAFSLQITTAKDISRNILGVRYLPPPKLAHQVPVVQRPDNFIRWIMHYSGSKIYFTLNVVQGFCILPNVAVVRVCIFVCTRGNTEIFA